MLTEEEVRAAARKSVKEMTGRNITDSEPLISSGLIDSLSVLKLIARLERHLGVAIPAGNLQPDDFESVDWIADTVLRVANL
jgi:acyl carrier protein